MSKMPRARDSAGHESCISKEAYKKAPSRARQAATDYFVR